MSRPSTEEAVRFEANDRCGLPVALSVGLQEVMLVLAMIVLIVAVTARASGLPEARGKQGDT